MNTVKPYVEATASTQVRSPVRLIGSAQSQGAAYTQVFPNVNLKTHIDIAVIQLHMLGKP